MGQYAQQVIDIFGVVFGLQQALADGCRVVLGCIQCLARGANHQGNGQRRLKALEIL